MRLAGLRSWIAHPLTAGHDLDDPRTTALRRRIIREKPFLRRIYEDWYDELAAALGDGPEPVLELGSGAGFLSDRLPNLLASDVMLVPEIDLVADATSLPFRSATLRAIVMVNVLHHVSDAPAFFREAARVVRPDGRIVMIEPWVTPWSRLVYRRLHHEPIDTAAGGWALPPGGPLSGANIALPWMIFTRDRSRFDAEFPEWAVRSLTPRMPVRYLLSGGVSMRTLMPPASYPLWRAIDTALERWAGQLAMFARIVLVRRAA